MSLLKVSLKRWRSAAKIVPMISACNAAIILFAFIAASTTPLIAQQDARTHLTIKVTDITGAPIPKAQVRLMSSADEKLLAFTADIEGIADVRLEPGEYQYRVGSQGFCPKNGTVTIDDAEVQQDLSAKLQVYSCPGPCAAPCVTVLGVALSSGYPVRIKVQTDVAGAVVSGALIEVDPSSSGLRTIKTDASGQAVIGLPTGTHSLRVSAPGFRQWHGFAEVQGSVEVITAKMRTAEKPIQGSSIVR